MRGPCLPGTLKVYEAHYDELLIRGKRYRVVREFFDLDDGFNKVGEEWTFLGSTYSIYDDMLEMQVQFPDRTEWTFQ